MCGIFGGISLRNKSLDINKIKILGIYNDSRGGDSCGYYYNGNIEKGIGKQENFIDFISDNEINKGNIEQKNEVFIGHTRKSTRGGNTKDNAHPHEYENLVQVHNGQFLNIESLCKKYDITHTYSNVDSKLFLQILHKAGWEVLSEYNGYAVLVWVNTDNPEEIYFFCGAQKVKGNLENERPIYLMWEDEGLYFSSLYFSLKALNFKSKILTLKPNRVIKAVVNSDNNEIELHTITEINRENVNESYEKAKAKTSFTPVQSKYVPGSVVKPAPKIEPNDPINLTEDKIYDDKLAGSSGYLKYLYYLGGRYRRGNGELLTGDFKISRSDKMIYELHETVTEKVFTDEATFYRGVLISQKGISAEEVDEFLAHLKNRDDVNFDLVKALSHLSRHPIIEDISEITTNKPFWKLEGVQWHGSFTPKYSDKIITVNKYGETLLVTPAK